MSYAAVIEFLSEDFLFSVFFNLSTASDPIFVRYSITIYLWQVNIIGRIINSQYM